jgi:ATP-dependent Clp protease ATP-binding subunit ClpX
MEPDTDPEKESNLTCSFCRKTQAEVRALIAGSRSTNICDECAVLCMEIVSRQALNIRAAWFYLS